MMLFQQINYRLAVLEAWKADAEKRMQAMSKAFDDLAAQVARTVASEAAAVAATQKLKEEHAAALAAAQAQADQAAAHATSVLASSQQALDAAHQPKPAA
jgi:phage-related minor tail protein